MFTTVLHSHTVSQKIKQHVHFWHVVQLVHFNFILHSCLKGSLKRLVDIMSTNSLEHYQAINTMNYSNCCIRRQLWAKRIDILLKSAACKTRLSSFLSALPFQLGLLVGSTIVMAMPPAVVTPYKHCVFVWLPRSGTQYLLQLSQLYHKGKKNYSWCQWEFIASRECDYACPWHGSWAGVFESSFDWITSIFRNAHV